MVALFWDRRRPRLHSSPLRLLWANVGRRGHLRSQKSAPVQSYRRIYSWDKNSRISFRSFSSWIRVKSFVPSRLIISGRSKGSLSYILPPLKWQPSHFDRNNGSIWVAKSTRDRLVETRTTSWALAVGVSDVIRLVRLHEYEITVTNDRRIIAPVRMAGCYSGRVSIAK